MERRARDLPLRSGHTVRTRLRIPSVCSALVVYCSSFGLFSSQRPGLSCVVDARVLLHTEPRGSSPSTGFRRGVASAPDSPGSAQKEQQAHDGESDHGDARDVLEDDEQHNLPAVDAASTLGERDEELRPDRSVDSLSAGRSSARVWRRPGHRIRASISQQQSFVSEEAGSVRSRPSKESDHADQDTSGDVLELAAHLRRGPTTTKKDAGLTPEVPLRQHGIMSVPRDVDEAALSPISEQKQQDGGVVRAPSISPRSNLLERQDEAQGERGWFEHHLILSLSCIAILTAVIVLCIGYWCCREKLERARAARARGARATPSGVGSSKPRSKEGKSSKDAGAAYEAYSRAQPAAGDSTTDGGGSDTDGSDSEPEEETLADIADNEETKEAERVAAKLGEAAASGDFGTKLNAILRDQGLDPSIATLGQLRRLLALDMDGDTEDAVQVIMEMKHTQKVRKLKKAVEDSAGVKDDVKVSAAGLDLDDGMKDEMKTLLEAEGLSAEAATMGDLRRLLGFGPAESLDEQKVGETLMKAKKKKKARRVAQALVDRKQSDSTKAKDAPNYDETKQLLEGAGLDAETASLGDVRKLLGLGAGNNVEEATKKIMSMSFAKKKRKKKKKILRPKGKVKPLKLNKDDEGGGPGDDGMLDPEKLAIEAALQKLGFTEKHAKAVAKTMALAERDGKPETKMPTAKDVGDTRILIGKKFATDATAAQYRQMIGNDAKREVKGHVLALSPDQIAKKKKRKLKKGGSGKKKQRSMSGRDDKDSEKDSETGRKRSKGKKDKDKEKTKDKDKDDGAATSEKEYPAADSDSGFIGLGLSGKANDERKAERERKRAAKEKKKDESGRDETPDESGRGEAGNKRLKANDERKAERERKGAAKEKKKKDESGRDETPDESGRDEKGNKLKDRRSKEKKKKDDELSGPKVLLGAAEETDSAKENAKLDERDKERDIEAALQLQGFGSGYAKKLAKWVVQNGGDGGPKGTLNVKPKTPPPVATPSDEKLLQALGFDPKTMTADAVTTFVAEKKKEKRKKKKETEKKTARKKEAEIHLKAVAMDPEVAKAEGVFLIKGFDKAYSRKLAEWTVDQERGMGKKFGAPPPVASGNNAEAAAKLGLDLSRGSPEAAKSLKNFVSKQKRKKELAREERKQALAAGKNVTEQGKKVVSGKTLGHLRQLLNPALQKQMLQLEATLLLKDLDRYYARELSVWAVEGEENGEPPPAAMTTHDAQVLAEMGFGDAAAGGKEAVKRLVQHVKEETEAKQAKKDKRVAEERKKLLERKRKEASLRRKKVEEERSKVRKEVRDAQGMLRLKGFENSYAKQLAEWLADGDPNKELPATTDKSQLALLAKAGLKPGAKQQNPDALKGYLKLGTERKKKRPDDHAAAGKKRERKKLAVAKPVLAAKNSEALLEEFKNSLGDAEKLDEGAVVKELMAQGVTADRAKATAKDLNAPTAELSAEAAEELEVLGFGKVENAAQVRNWLATEKKVPKKRAALEDGFAVDVDTFNVEDVDNVFLEADGVETVLAVVGFQPAVRKKLAEKMVAVQDDEAVQELDVGALLADMKDDLNENDFAAMANLGISAALTEEGAADVGDLTAFLKEQQLAREAREIARMEEAQHEAEAAAVVDAADQELDELGPDSRGGDEDGGGACSCCPCLFAGPAPAKSPAPAKPAKHEAAKKEKGAERRESKREPGETDALLSGTKEDGTTVAAVPESHGVASTFLSQPPGEKVMSSMAAPAGSAILSSTRGGGGSQARASARLSLAVDRHNKWIVEEEARDALDQLGFEPEVAKTLAAKMATRKHNPMDDVSELEMTAVNNASLDGHDLGGITDALLKEKRVKSIFKKSVAAEDYEEFVRAKRKEATGRSSVPRDSKLGGEAGIGDVDHTLYHDQT